MRWAKLGCPRNSFRVCCTLYFIAALCTAHNEPTCFSLREHRERPEELSLYTHLYPHDESPPRRATCPRTHPIDHSLDPCYGQPLASKPRVQLLTMECRVPTFFPDAEFSSAMTGRTLWLWGGTTMAELFETILHCSAKNSTVLQSTQRETYGAVDKRGNSLPYSFSKGKSYTSTHTSAHHQTPATSPYKAHRRRTNAWPGGWTKLEHLAERVSSELPPELRDIATHAACPHIHCAMLPSGVSTCFMQYDEEVGVTEPGTDGPDIPCLRAVRLRDVVLLNFGGNDEARPYDRLRAEVERLVDWKTRRDAARVESPLLIWHEFLPQHYDVPGGNLEDVPAGTHPELCMPRVNTHTMPQFNYRNDAVRPILSAARIPVLPVWRVGVQLRQAHPGEGDCSTWCHYEGDLLEEVWKVVQLFVMGQLAEATDLLSKSSQDNLDLGRDFAVKHGVTFILEPPHDVK